MADPDLGRRTVGAVDQPVSRHRGVRAIPHPGERAGDGLPFSGADQAGQPGTGHVGRAEKALRRRGRVVDHPVILDDQDRVGTVLDHGADVRPAVFAASLGAAHYLVGCMRGLPGDDLQGLGPRGQARRLAEHGKHAGRWPVPGRQRAEQHPLAIPCLRGAVTGTGRQQHRARRRGLGQPGAHRRLVPPGQHRDARIFPGWPGAAGCRQDRQQSGTCPPGQQGLQRVPASHRADGGLGGGRHLFDRCRGREGRRGHAQGPLPAQGTPVGDRRLRQAGEHDQIKDATAEVHHAGARVPVLGRRQGDQGTRHGQGRQREQDQPGYRRARGPARRRLGQHGHRRVERGGSPGPEAEQPAQRDRQGRASAAVELPQRVAKIRGSEPGCARREQPGRPGRDRARSKQPGRYREDQHVTQRKCGREGPVRGDRAGAAGEHQPEQAGEGAAGRKNKRVKDALPRPAGGPPPEEDRQPGDGQRAGSERKAIPDPRGGHAGTRRAVGDQESCLAGRQARAGPGQQQPWPAPGGPVQRHAHRKGGGAAGADERPGQRAQIRKGGIKGGKHQNPRGITSHRAWPPVQCNHPRTRVRQVPALPPGKTPAVRCTGS